MQRSAVDATETLLMSVAVGPAGEGASPRLNPFHLGHILGARGGGEGTCFFAFPKFPRPPALPGWLAGWTLDGIPGPWMAVVSPAQPSPSPTQPFGFGGDATRKPWESIEGGLILLF